MPSCNLLTFSDIKIDFGNDNKNRLIAILTEIEKTPLSKVNNGYSIKVSLKDDSMFAYAPRRFAFAERLEIRKITDDLLVRGIIKYSSSPYCARVVAVLKKNGCLCLCVDLCPLNA